MHPPLQICHFAQVVWALGVVLISTPSSQKEERTKHEDVCVCTQRWYTHSFTALAERRNLVVSYSESLCVALIPVYSPARPPCVVAVSAS